MTIKGSLGLQVSIAIVRAF